MMLRAHGLLDDSEMVDFIRMAATQGGTSSNLMSQYEKMLIDYEDDEDEDDDDDEQEFDEAELAQIAQIRALAMQQQQRKLANGGGGGEEEDEEDEYADEEDEEEMNDEAATRMMMMMDEQEKLYMHQQMLEREYLKASTASVLAKGKAPINGNIGPIEESKMAIAANGLIGGMIPPGLPAGLVDIDDELGEEILAGGNNPDEAVDESAYKKMMMQSGYPGGS